MKLKGLIHEDITNYKKMSMCLIFPTCSFKCDKEAGRTICQNSELACAPNIEITEAEVVRLYLNNPLTSAIVCAGLEPFDSKFDLLTFVDCVRRGNDCKDDIVVYTGYKEEELEDEKNINIYQVFQNLKKYENIIVKFGRFIPDQEKCYDEVLGVHLASPNQYARKIT